jgi:hypothetical protein
MRSIYDLKVSVSADEKIFQQTQVLEISYLNSLIQYSINVGHSFFRNAST